ncbi:MAG: DUF1761 family protein [Caldithrix sp.]|nr:DUF1761 family protein [Caldithrix sp.]
MEINYLFVIIAGIVYFAGGALWYSPLLFGKSWMKEIGLTQEDIKDHKSGVWKSYLIALIAQLFISYGLARLMVYVDVTTIADLLHMVFWSWLTFVVTTSAINGTFAGKSLKLWAIDNGYHLYGFFAAGLILSLG